MKLRLRQQAPEPKLEEDAEVPTLGIHPYLDMLAMQAFILRQQANIFRHQTRLYRMINWLAAVWAVLALLWVFDVVVHAQVLLPLLRR